MPDEREPYQRFVAASAKTPPQVPREPLPHARSGDMRPRSEQPATPLPQSESIRRMFPFLAADAELQRLIAAVGVETTERLIAAARDRGLGGGMVRLQLRAAATAPQADGQDTSVETGEAEPREWESVTDDGRDDTPVIDEPACAIDADELARFAVFKSGALATHLGRAIGARLAQVEGETWYIDGLTFDEVRACTYGHAAVWGAREGAQIGRKLVFMQRYSATIREGVA